MKGKGMRERLYIDTNIVTRRDREYTLNEYTEIGWDTRRRDGALFSHITRYKIIIINDWTNE